MHCSLVVTKITNLIGAQSISFTNFRETQTFHFQQNEDDAKGQIYISNEPHTHTQLHTHRITYKGIKLASTEPVTGASSQQTVKILVKHASRRKMFEIFSTETTIKLLNKHE